MTVTIAVVCEAAADFQTGADLLDRILRETVDWLAELDLILIRRFVGESDVTTFVPWTQVDDVARKRNIRIHGHFDKEPGKPDAKSARRAVLTMKVIHRRLDAVVLLRDSDGYPERREGLEQARQRFSGDSMAIVIGFAHPCREAWVLAGFEPAEGEHSRLAEELTRLKFDPRTNSDQLRTRPPGNDRHPKRIVETLTEDNWNRQANCWRDTALAVLRERGQSNGLTSYLGEVKERLVPLVAGRPR